ncbi:IS3 family transposase [Mucilaginibacter terrae]|uniref:IS3 family transposase n=1 Tax=Mucilaginibacter terrae TaxID=1955052 RepID=UPI00289DD1C5|nr:IS3 family transposase [Mucilaginibacter terrae]
MTAHSRGLRELCGLLGYSTQAYYQYLKATERRSFGQEEFVQQVLAYRREQPRIGTRKLFSLLQPAIGRDAFFVLLRESGLLVRQKRRHARTTFSYHRFRKYPDLVKEMVIDRPGQLWVSDITYIRMGEGFAYLSLVTDAYSRKVIGFSMSHDLSTDNCLQALKMALKQWEGDHPLVHHSDRGIQYCSGAYTELLKQNGISISMTQSGNPRDNAIAERVNGILKMELLQERYADISSARQSIRQAVVIYNTLRPHSSLDMMTPEQAHRLTGPIKRRWQNYYPVKQQYADVV